MKKYKRIRELREDSDITQTKIAQKLNISQRTYSRYENGVSTIPLEILVKIADFHNVSTDYLLERTDIQRPYGKKQ
ncbi:MAG: helix-turn-helix domain-containing protein [Acutalibacteraceae bacterium]